MEADLADTISTDAERDDLQFPNKTFPSEISSKQHPKSSTTEPISPNFLSARAQRALSKIKAKAIEDIPVNLPLRFTDAHFEPFDLHSTSLSKQAQRALDRIKYKNLSNSRLDQTRILNRHAERIKSQFDIPNSLSLPPPRAATAPFASADKSRHSPIFLHTSRIKEAEQERQLGQPSVPERPRFADPVLALASLLQCTAGVRSSGGGARRSLETGFFPQSQVCSS